MDNFFFFSCKEEFSLLGSNEISCHGFEFKTSLSPVLNGNIYPMYVLTLHFESILLVFWFIGAHMNRNFAQGWMKNILIHHLFRRHLIKIWNLELMLKRVKALGDVVIR